MTTTLRSKSKVFDNIKDAYFSANAKDGNCDMVVKSYPNLLNDCLAIIDHFGEYDYTPWDMIAEGTSDKASLVSHQVGDSMPYFHNDDEAIKSTKTHLTYKWFSHNALTFTFSKDLTIIILLNHPEGNTILEDWIKTGGKIPTTKIHIIKENTI